MLRRLFSLALFLALCAGALFVWSVWQPHAEWGGFRQRLGDAKTTGAVKTALELNRSLATCDISVAAEEGVVTLRGTVGQAELRQRAEEVALAVEGVRQVVNHLHVVPGQPPVSTSERSLGESIDDAALEMRVRLAFSLRRDLDGVALEVKAFRRTVTLKGDLADEVLRDTAVRVARETPGVGEVISRISVLGNAELDGSSPLERARAALSTNPSLVPHDLVVRERAGHIIVSGIVETQAERDLAGLLVERAVGGEVENEIVIRR